MALGSPPPEAHLYLAQALQRRRRDDDGPAFVVEDGRYLSGRWPGDAYLLAVQWELQEEWRVDRRFLEPFADGLTGPVGGTAKHGAGEPGMPEPLGADREVEHHFGERGGVVVVADPIRRGDREVLRVQALAGDLRLQHFERHVDAELAAIGRDPEGFEASRHDYEEYAAGIDEVVAELG